MDRTNVLSNGRKSKQAPSSPSMRALIPFMRIPSLWLNHFLKTPPVNTITMGIKFQYMNFTIASSSQLLKIHFMTSISNSKELKQNYIYFKK
jgi:hypothetical protein